MKRVLTMVCTIALSFSLVACSSVHEVTPEELAEEEAWKNSCVEMDYDTLAHNASNMKGQRVKITGKIFQVVNNAFSKAYMFDMRNPYDTNDMNFMQHVYLTASKDSNLIENDQVTIYGTVEGTQTYTTVLGAQRTVPKVKIKYVTNEGYKRPTQLYHLPDGTWALYDPNTGETTYYPTNPYDTPQMN